MIVHKHIVAVPSYDTLRHFHYEELQDTETLNMHLWLGSQGDCPIDPTQCNFFFDGEQPNMWFHDDSLKNALLNETRYKHILSICPYTSKWRNKILQRNQYIAIPYFLNAKYVPQKAVDKDIDIIYIGHVNPLFSIIAEAMSPFNHYLVSGQESIGYQEKFNLIARSKISLVHNVIYVSPETKTFVKAIDRYSENEIFSGIDAVDFIPQLKSREFEAAFCRSLILCFEDNYNVIERYFEPSKEFIYLKENNTKEQIQFILDHYNDFIPMINRAYEKAMDLYTAKNILKVVKETL